MPITKNIVTKVIIEPIEGDIRNSTYSLYKHAQDENSSRGLITRTLSYHEFIIFCLKANPISRYGRLYDWNKYEKKIKKHMKNIPLHIPDIIDPLLLEENFYDKVYAFCMDYGLSLDKLILYNVYELIHVKNPRNENLYDLSWYKHEQPSWIHPPVPYIPLTDTEESLVKVNHIQRSVQNSLEMMKRYKEIYGTLTNDDCDTLCRLLNEAICILNDIKKRIE